MKGDAGPAHHHFLDFSLAGFALRPISTQNRASGRRDMPSVVLELGRKTAREGERRTFDGDLIVFGRSRSCDLRFQVGGVSRMHARIALVSANRWSIEDLNSRNGTFVNGEQVNRAFVRVGDRLQIGAAGPEIRIIRLDPDPAMPPPA
jgi:hypothetical protein